MQFYVYDSFAGLPEKTAQDTSPLGIQFKAGELLASKKQFIKNMMQAGVPVPHIKKAWFKDLTQNDVPSTIAFAFLDGDYYQSVVDSLKLIEKRLSPGATIIVDDYGNAGLPGASKAVDEWLHKHPALLKVEQTLAVIYTKR
jgi:O-methyltransferase